MNSIFVVTENLITENGITKTSIKQPYITKAFKTKRQAFDLIEQFYYADIETIKQYDCSSISNVYIGNNAVRIRGSYRFDNGSYINFLYEYRIEEIPFE